MNIIKAISYIQFNNNGILIPLKEAATVLNVSEKTIQNYKTKDIPQEWIKILEKKYGCKLPCEIASSTELAHNYMDVQYWEHCDSCKNKLRKASVTQVCVDAEVFVNDLNLTLENAFVIAMPSNTMDGGDRPIKYGDILLIDKSCTDISYSGIYFYVSEKTGEAFVNLIDKSLDRIYFKFKNIDYETKVYTQEQLDNAGFKVIGRVVHNCSERL